MHLLEDIQAFWQNKRVLVTGAAGFIGSYVSYQLTQSGANVIRVDRTPAKATVFEKDLLNALILPIKVEDNDMGLLLSTNKFDVVFHLAGVASPAQSVIDPLWDFESNLQATVLFLESLRKHNFCGRIVYTSSAAVYGQPGSFPISENTTLAPISAYGVSKLSAEHYIQAYAKLYKFNAVIARIFSVYGPGLRRQVIFDIIRKAVPSKDEIELFGSGYEVRDFMYIEDVVTALLYLGSLSSVNTNIFNICSGQSTSIQTLAEIILKILGDDTSRIRFTNQGRAGDPVSWVGCNRLLTSTGFQTKTDIKEGLYLTVDWCKQHL